VSKTAEAGKEAAEGAAGDQPRLDANGNATLVAMFVDGQEDPLLDEEQVGTYNTMQPEDEFKNQRSKILRRTSDAHTGVDGHDGLILKIMNTSDAANSYQASAFFQNDVIS